MHVISLVFVVKQDLLEMLYWTGSTGYACYITGFPSSCNVKCHVSCTSMQVCSCITEDFLVLSTLTGDLHTN